MEHLTANEVTLLVATASLAGGLMGWFGRGIGFLLTRWWTGSPSHERANYLNTVVDLGAKLRANGMTMDEVQLLEEMVRKPSIKSSDAATQTVTQIANNEPSAFSSNYAMKMRTRAASGVAEAKLDQVLQDLRLLVSDDEWECVENAQEHWVAYRDALAEGARREYEGGTHAGLAAVLTAVAETDRRTEEIQAQVDERSAR